MWEGRATGARREIAALATAGLGVAELHRAAIDLVEGVVPTELTCWASLDPDTAVISTMTSGPTRAIVRLLIAEGDRPCGTFGLPVAASTLSHHFRALRQAGIIREWDEGRQRMNTLRLDELDTRFPGLVAKVLDAD